MHKFTENVVAPRIIKMSTHAAEQLGYSIPCSFVKDKPLTYSVGGD